MEGLVNIQRLPSWLRKAPGSVEETRELKKLLRKTKLNTVCEEARCPNIAECFSQGTATFMILGDVCTRGCRFCSVKTGKPSFSEDNFEEEAQQVVEATKALGLKHVVVTSVARDDLNDGGASGFVSTISALRREIPKVSIEVLIPDFRGNKASIAKVVEAKPDVLNHNLETVPRLYRRVRPGANYKRSLELLSYAKEIDPTMVTKTGIMLGLGEQKEEVKQLLEDAFSYQIEIFTAGQYMRPAKEFLPVEEYLSIEKYEEYQQMAKQVGFKHVFIGPLVRSSYHAGEEFSKVAKNPEKHKPDHTVS